MKCFNHASTDAVGICKYCVKGVCTTCAVDSGHGTACSLPCAEQLKVEASLVRLATTATRMNSRGAAYFFPAYFVFLGVVFIGYARLWNAHAEIGPLLMVLGGGFTAFGLVFGAMKYVWLQRSRLSAG